MSVKKLTKSQRKLLESWRRELSAEVEDFKNVVTGLLQRFAAVTNEVLNNRIELMARTELDIDLDEGDWEFDDKEMAFKTVEKEEKPEPKETIPSGKKKNTKKKKVN